ncbi:MAG TPA: sugar ABC transporter ATP-binding protein [Actinomycetes bacterium]|nr:sugar ABC transporter ATP-binding protein [Actinomycetes bacterium]
MTQALVLSNASKRFGATQALDGVSVAFAPGEVHALVGENGAGKSTLLGIVSGVVRPDPPSAMEIGGRAVDLARWSPKAAQAAGISVVPQELAVIDPMTVAENIFLGREPRRGPILDRREMRRRARELLARLGASFSADEPVERLGMAQLQVLEIAKALSISSQVVAMDEPSAVLAGDELDSLFRVIHQLVDDGVAVIYVSHRLDEVFAHCDRFTVLKDGRVVGSGLVREVRRADLVRMMVGREIAETFPGRARKPGRVLLEVSDLSVAGKLEAVTFQAREGEILGIAGLMGSGRTTLAKAIFGAVPVASGTVAVDGARGPFRSPWHALRAGLAYLPEDRRREGLALSKTVRWNASMLGLGKLSHGMARLIPPAAERELVRRLVIRLSIRTAPYGEDVVGRLSGGNQQKVVLAKWLEAGPKVLILDEPTRGIDVGTKEEVYALLRALTEQGLAVVVISSELIEVLGLADRILVVADGRVAGELQGERATEEAVMRLATGSRGPHEEESVHDPAR